jgi:hypothetical protein
MQIDAKYHSLAICKSTTFLSTVEAARIFGTRFRVRDIVPQANDTSPDLVVCERL